MNDDVNESEEAINLEAQTEILESLAAQDFSDPDVFNAVSNIIFDNWDLLT